MNKKADDLFFSQKRIKTRRLCAEVRPQATVATSSSASNEINIITLTMLRPLVRRTEMHPKFTVKSLPGD